MASLVLSCLHRESVAKSMVKEDSIWTTVLFYWWHFTIGCDASERKKFSEVILGQWALKMNLEIESQHTFKREEI